MAVFPLTVLANFSTAAAILISELPPPYKTLLFLTVLTNTQIASWKERSASSKMCLEEPLKTMVQDLLDLHPENLMNLSSPIRISSIF